MQQDQSSLAALIGSRICHDLINPIGAISNGLELVSLGAPSPASPEMSLIQQSCDNATARIRFFRIAFGSAGDQRPVPTAEAAKTLSNHFEGTRFQTGWTLCEDVGRDVVQLAYLGVLCMETALPQGGTITVSLDGTTLAITGQGPETSLDEALWSWVSADGSEPGSTLRPAHVQFALLRNLCPDRVIEPETGSENGAITLRLGRPAGT